MDQQTTMTEEELQQSDDEFEVKSKSQVKREMHALQELGSRLVELDKQKLNSLELPEALFDAIETAQKIRQHGALKRQLQYIGKVMRDIDPEPIQQYLDKLDGKDKQANALLHRCENWRDRLLAEGNEALDSFFQEYPDADRQHIRQLVRNAIKEQQQNKPAKSARALFRSIRELAEG